MKVTHLTIAAAAAGLLLAASVPASATPLGSISSAPLGIDRFDGQVEPVHYRRRAVRSYHNPYYGYRRYRSGPVISFGVSPYYPWPYAYSPYGYGYSYPYGYGYSAYPYSYGYGPTFSFGFGFR